MISRWELAGRSGRARRWEPRHFLHETTLISTQTNHLGNPLTNILCDCSGFFLIHPTRRCLLNKVFYLNETMMHWHWLKENVKDCPNVNFTMWREERGEKLKNWFPRCACQVCSGPAPKLERSDRIRRELAALHNQVFLKSCKFRICKSHVGEGADQKGQTERGPGCLHEEGQPDRGAGGRAVTAGGDKFW